MFAVKSVRSKLLIAVTALAVVATGAAQLVAPAAPAGAAPAVQQAQKVSWTPCRDGFQCGTLAVPLDYGNPSGPTVPVALIKLPAGQPKKRIGSLLLNPGGPGGSGVDMARGFAPILPLELRGRFDIVGFDPRGILRGTPLRCFNTLGEAFDVLPKIAFPLTRAEEDGWSAADRKLGEACASHGGAIRDHMSTADAARDMDSIRQALGDSKLTYLGFSYGSFLGQVYANLFPNRVRALAIDGVIDPIAWTTGHGQQGRTVPVGARLGSDKGTQATVGEFFRLCDAAGTKNCVFAGDSAARYAAMLAKLKVAPFVFGTPPNTYNVTYADVVGTTVSLMYAPFLWELFASMLLDLESHAPAAKVLAGFAALRSRLGLDKAAQEPYPNFVEGHPGVLCSDSVNPTSVEAWRRAAAASDAKNNPFGRPWTWWTSVCQAWPATAGQDRYLGPWTARTSAPVLIVGNYFDPATPYQGAVTASRLLPNSRLLSYAGWGHTAFFGGNFCIDDHVTRYLVTTKVPPARTVCQPGSSPFESIPALAAQRAKAAAVLGVPLLPESARRAMNPAHR